MKKLLSKILIAAVVLSLLGCEKNNLVTGQDTNKETFAGNLEITTEKPAYSFNEIFSGNFISLNAVLENISQDTFYTKLGDVMVGSIDQEQLYIAQNTDGYFEKNTAENKWKTLEAASMYEGSRIVRILPLQRYNLRVAVPIPSDIEGKFRLKINYYKNFNTVVDTLIDASNKFYINE